MNSLKARTAAKKHKRRPASELRPASRRTRNADPRGKQFMEFVRMHPCVVCTRTCEECRGKVYPTCCQGRGDCCGVPVEFAHVGERGLGSKGSNMQGIPLCSRHGGRTSKDAIHVLGKKFWEHHGLDRNAIVSHLQAEFNRLHPETPTASEESQ